MFSFCFITLFTIVAILAYKTGHTDGRHFALKEIKQQALLNPQPVNVINSIVLPEPDDPRWQLKYTRHRKQKYFTYVLHNIHMRQSNKEPNKVTIAMRDGSMFTNLDHNLATSAQCWNYFMAVDKAFIDRKALEAIVS